MPSRPVPDGNLIFGNDTAEIVALRNLEKAVWKYIKDDIDVNELTKVALEVKITRRHKKAN